MKPISKTAEKIFRVAINRVHKQKADGVDGYWRIGAPGGAYMPLCVECIGETRFGKSEPLKLWSFAHYYEQEGDAMRDPDVIMMDAPGGLYPVGFRQDSLGIDNEAVVYNDGNISGVKVKMQADITSFCNDWAQNLKHQQGL